MLAFKGAQARTGASRHRSFSGTMSIMSDPQPPANPSAVPQSEPSQDDAKAFRAANAQNQFRVARVEKLAALRRRGVNPYPYRFDRTKLAAALDREFADLGNDVRTGHEVRVAGRIRAIRNSGMFIDLHDFSGKIQIFSTKDQLSEDQLQIVKLLDLGDVIGVTGTVRRTKRGELTVDATKVELLSKALLPLPEKYHGLQDVETRYRQRYLDLIMNPASRETLQKRSLIIATIRGFMIARGFLKVETPMLHTQPGGAAARPFITHHNTLDMELYLRIAPELYLKRLIVGGLADAVFEINRNFRNEGISPRHNPEFTMMELYQAFADYNDMAELAEALLEHVAVAATGGTTVKVGDQEISFKGPFARHSMIELVKDRTGVDFAAIDSDEEGAPQQCASASHWRRMVAGARRSRPSSAPRSSICWSSRLMSPTCPAKFRRWRKSIAATLD